MSDMTLAQAAEAVRMGLRLFKAFERMEEAVAFLSAREQEVRERERERRGKEAEVDDLAQRIQRLAREEEELAARMEAARVEAEAMVEAQRRKAEALVAQEQVRADAVLGELKEGVALAREEALRRKRTAEERAVAAEERATAAEGRLEELRAELKVG